MSNLKRKQKKLKNVLGNTTLAKTKRKNKPSIHARLHMRQQKLLSSLKSLYFKFVAASKTYSIMSFFFQNLPISVIYDQNYITFVKEPRKGCVKAQYQSQFSTNN